MNAERCTDMGDCPTCGGAIVGVEDASGRLELVHRCPLAACGVCHATIPATDLSTSGLCAACHDDTDPEG